MLLAVLVRHGRRKASVLSSSQDCLHGNPYTWKGLFCLSNSLICFFSSLVVLLSVNASYSFFLPLSLPCHDECLLFWFVEAHTCVCLHQYTPECLRMFLSSGTLSSALLISSQPFPWCALSPYQTASWKSPKEFSGWGIRNFQRCTLFHRILFDCSCPVLKADRHY